MESRNRTHPSTRFKTRTRLHHAALIVERPVASTHVRAANRLLALVLDEGFRDLLLGAGELRHAIMTERQAVEDAARHAQLTAFGAYIMFGR